jgi:hypothetical protein
MNKAKTFLDRLPADAPPVAAEHITTAWSIFDSVSSKIATIKSDVTLTAAGKAIAIEKLLTAGPLDHLSQIRADIEKYRAVNHDQRKVLRERVMKSDAFTESRLLEVRSWLRGLSREERLEAMKLKDEVIVQAIIGAEWFLSNTPPELWERTVNATVEAKFPGAMAQIEMVERAYENAAASAQLALDDVRRTSGLPADEFGKLAA